MHPHVTFIVGENGSGKSTLLEAFLSLLCDRFRRNGLHFDEPEAALSPDAQLAAVARIRSVEQAVSSLLQLTRRSLWRTRMHRTSIERTVSYRSITWRQSTIRSQSSSWRITKRCSVSLCRVTTADVVQLLLMRISSTWNDQGFVPHGRYGDQPIRDKRTVQCSDTLHQRHVAPLEDRQQPVFCRQADCQRELAQQWQAGNLVLRRCVSEDDAEWWFRNEQPQPRIMICPQVASCRFRDVVVKQFEYG